MTSKYTHTQKQQPPSLSHLQIRASVPDHCHLLGWLLLNRGGKPQYYGRDAETVLCTTGGNANAAAAAGNSMALLQKGKTESLHDVAILLVDTHTHLNYFEALPVHLFLVAFFQ